MRILSSLFSLIVLLSLTGCDHSGWCRPQYASPPPVVVRGDANEYGVHAGVQFDVGTFLATRSDPELHFQNQAGGWERIDNRGWIDLPINQGGLTFHIIPNGHFVGYDAVLDGVPIGGGGNLFFGFGTGTHDNGKHLLLVTVQRKYSPDLGDPVPEEVIDKHTFKVIVFYKASW